MSLKASNNYIFKKMAVSHHGQLQRTNSFDWNRVMVHQY